jgi:hypothetical protein
MVIQGILLLMMARFYTRIGVGSNIPETKVFTFGKSSTVVLVQSTIEYAY